MADSDSIKLCECGCGKPAPIANMTRKERGQVKGQPLRFLRNHWGSRRTHGAHGSRTYVSWSKMIERCTKPDEHHRRYYSGIGVCDRWRKFENFLADMGERPADTSLDRIDNTGNYEPTNCRWATKRQQLRNRSDSLPVDLHALSARTGIKYETLRVRFSKGDRGERLIRPFYSR